MFFGHWGFWPNGFCLVANVHGKCLFGFWPWGFWILTMGILDFYPILHSETPQGLLHKKVKTHASERGFSIENPRSLLSPVIIDRKIIFKTSKMVLSHGVNHILTCYAHFVSIYPPQVTMEFPFDLALGSASGQVEGKLHHHPWRLYRNFILITGEYILEPRQVNGWQPATFRQIFFTI